jgi:hypothetical protein
VNDVDQALVAQQHDRLPRRPTRHAMLGDQLMLTGQLLTRLQPPSRDRRTQQVRDLLIDRPISLRINHGTQSTPSRQLMYTTLHANEPRYGNRREPDMLALAEGFC